MPEYTHNEGVSISDSTVSGPVAGGANAQAIQYGGGAAVSESAAAAHRILTALKALIEANATAIPDARHALADVADIGQEINKSAPDGRRLRDTLKRLAARLAPVIAAIGLVADLDQLIGSILGRQ
jgi:ABC-type transporter Mla subunit MlaD